MQDVSIRQKFRKQSSMPYYASKNSRVDASCMIKVSTGNKVGVGLGREKIGDGKRGACIRTS
jgi:hypothetical protein